MFIAHNGKKYDFKIIKSNYERYCGRSHSSVGMKATTVSAADDMITSAITSSATTVDVNANVENTPDMDSDNAGITNSTSMFWFENRPDILVSYRFLDTLEIFRTPDMWQQQQVEQQESTTTTTTTTTTTEITSTTNSNENDNEKLPRPPSNAQLVLYQHITGKVFENGHNAVFDVEALAAMLTAPSIAKHWKSIARRKLF